jgi:hypothetical protein
MILEPESGRPTKTFFYRRYCLIKMLQLNIAISQLQYFIIKIYQLQFLLQVSTKN